MNEAEVQAAAAVENQKALIIEAYRRTEKRLEAQLAVAIAFDHRSYVLAAVSIASAGYLLSGPDDGGSEGFFVGAAVFLTLSAFLASLSAQPSSLYTVGSKASELKDFIDDGHDPISVIYGLAINNDRYIDANNVSANIRNAVFRLAVFMFLIGLVLGAIALMIQGS